MLGFFISVRAIHLPGIGIYRGPRGSIPCSTELTHLLTTAEVASACYILPYYAYEDIQSICPLFYAYSGAN
eukprot:COSAG06_NODE_5317_length_3567_cov_2.205882_2_plen_71_part_00